LHVNIEMSFRAGKKFISLALIRYPLATLEFLVTLDFEKFEGFLYHLGIKKKFPHKLWKKKKTAIFLCNKINYISIKRLFRAIREGIYSIREKFLADFRTVTTPR